MPDGRAVRVRGRLRVVWGLLAQLAQPQRRATRPGAPVDQATAARAIPRPPRRPPIRTPTRVRVATSGPPGDTRARCASAPGPRSRCASMAVKACGLPGNVPASPLGWSATSASNSCARPAKEPRDSVSTRAANSYSQSPDAVWPRRAAGACCCRACRRRSPSRAALLLLQEHLVGGAEQSQLQLRAGEFEVEHGQGGQRLPTQGPGEVGGAGVGVGGLEGREHGSAPQRRKGKRSGPAHPGRHRESWPGQPGRGRTTSQSVRSAASGLPGGTSGGCVGDIGNHELGAATAFLPNLTGFHPPEGSPAQVFNQAYARRRHVPRAPTEPGARTPGSAHRTTGPTRRTQA